MTATRSYQPLARARSASHGVRKAYKVAQQDGARGLGQRLARIAYQRTGAASLNEPLLAGDVADSTLLDLPIPDQRPSLSRPLVVSWVCAPPSLGSGGHTTMFRMVEALEAAGHICRLHLYDRYGGDLAQHRAVVRRGWPGVKAEVLDARAGIRGVDAAIATSWDSAHVLARHGTAPMRRLYFVQDYEPYFYACGSEYALAEDTYRFGFRTVALGHMVAETLKSEVGVAVDVTQFGCDTDTYHLIDPAAPRSGVVFYARPAAARRGYWLARLALERFHEEHSDIPIYAYGSTLPRLPFPVTVYPRLTPAELNRLYNRVSAGLAMSFTNISLVAEEMLSAGATPVVNDSWGSRADLDSADAIWASATPSALARALGQAATAPDQVAAARRAAGSVRRGWKQTQEDMVRIVEDEVYGPL